MGLNSNANIDKGESHERVNSTSINQPQSATRRDINRTTRVISSSSAYCGAEGKNVSIYSLVIKYKRLHRLNVASIIFFI